MAPGREINGVGVAVVTLGLVVGWAGFRNVPLLEAFKQLAMGQAPAPNPKAAYTDVTLSMGGGAGTIGEVGTGAGAAGIVAMAATVAGSAAGRARYCWGGGHTSNPCGARCFDCSGYVSCVLNRLGLYKGSTNTLGFLAWKGATTVPWEQRQPGDLLVNAGHIGIAIDDKTMWNAACTACGPVKKSRYERKYTVRRVKGAPTSSGGGAQATPIPNSPRRTIPNLGVV